MKPKKKIWQAFETPAGLARAAADWQSSLGTHFEAIKPFLRAKKGLAAVVPCPVRPPCDCDHGVVEHGRDDLVAVCRCEPKRCQTAPINRLDAVIYEVDRVALGAAIAKALDAKIEKSPTIDPRRALRIGTFEAQSGYSLPVFLTIQSDEAEMERVADTLATDEERPFILSAPTGTLWTPDLDKLLRRHKGRFIALSDVLSINGAIYATHSLKETLADFFQEILPPPEEQFIFRKDGATWTVAFGGDPKSVLEMKGLHYIARLLSNPNQEILCSQLSGTLSTVPMESDMGPNSPARSDDASRGEERSRKKEKRVHVDAVLDAEAISNYRKKLDGLKEQIAQAKELGNTEEAAQLAQEEHTLADEIGSKVYHGKGRRKGALEKSRQAVSIAIERALLAIKEVHSALWTHLDTAIRRGIILAYRPDRDISWVLRR